MSGLHNTLVFLGSVEQNRLESLLLAAQELVACRFDICFDEARYWAHKRIVYAAPRHIPLQLAQLVDALQQQLDVHRFTYDRRIYQPHVTLLRNASWNESALPPMPPVSWHVHDFALLQSRDGAADYQGLARFPLIYRAREQFTSFVGASLLAK